jgi:hypothetical protein
MNNDARRKVTGKRLALVALAAALTAVIITVAQDLLLGRANIAVTGGVVGAVTAVVAFSTMKNTSGS